VTGVPDCAQQVESDPGQRSADSVGGAGQGDAVEREALLFSQLDSGDRLVEHEACVVGGDVDVAGETAGLTDEALRGNRWRH